MSTNIDYIASVHACKGAKVKSMNTHTRRPELAREEKLQWIPRAMKIKQNNRARLLLRHTDAALPSTAARFVFCHCNASSASRGMARSAKIRAQKTPRPPEASSWAADGHACIDCEVGWSKESVRKEQY